MKEYFKIRVGNSVFSVKAEEELDIELHPGIEPFCEKEIELTNQVEINIYKGFPVFKEKPRQITNARNLREFRDHEIHYHYYTLNKTSDQFIIYTGEEFSDREFEKIAVSDFNYRKWSVYVSEQVADSKINPLKFPIGPLVFYYGTTLNNGILMHASGVKYDSKGFIFSGVSGIGKTTMSNFWLDRGGDLINDDRLMLMHDGNGFLMYNTPMAYKQEVKCSPVSAIFLLKKSPDNKSIRLTKGFALARIISHCIQHSHDKKLMDSLVENASKLIENVPVYELGFKPDVSVVDYIRNLEF